MIPDCRKIEVDDERQAEGHQRPGADPIGEPAGQRAHDDEHDRGGQETQPRLQGRVMQDVLHVEREKEELGQHREADEEADDVGAEERAGAEELEAGRRSLTRLSIDGEGGEGEAGEAEQAEDPVEPQCQLLPSTRAAECGEADRDRPDARQVDAVPTVSSRESRAANRVTATAMMAIGGLVKKMARQLTAR